MFNQDLTVVNKYINSTTHLPAYKCSSVKGFWSSNKGISFNGVDIVNNDGLVVRILKSEAGYIDPKLYVGSGWTLKNDDYLIKGAVSSITSIASMKESYECMKITNVAVKDYGSSEMQHFDVSGE